MQFIKSLCELLNKFLFNCHSVSLKKSQEKKDYTLERKSVANLIMAVLTERLSVREAILRFPKNCDDVCISVAWHALVHYEADEDISSVDTVFKDVQVDFLEGLYNILIEGKDLPENLIRGYNKYHKGVDTTQTIGRDYFWHEMKKNLAIND